MRVQLPRNAIARFAFDKNLTRFNIRPRLVLHFDATSHLARCSCEGPYVKFISTSASDTRKNELVQPTIYALSTAPGRAAIAVIRVSGVGCKKVFLLST